MPGQDHFFIFDEIVAVGTYRSEIQLITERFILKSENVDAISNFVGLTVIEPIKLDVCSLF